MMKKVAGVSLVLVVAAFVACSKEADQSAQSPTYGQTGYGQTSGSPGQYQQGTTQYPQTGQYPTATATTTATAANPLALACQTDATCITAKCNLQTGHCMFPCASSADCQTGNGCVAGACLPGAP